MNSDFRRWLRCTVLVAGKPLVVPALWGTERGLDLAQCGPYPAKVGWQWLTVFEHRPEWLSRESPLPVVGADGYPKAAFGRSYDQVEEMAYGPIVFTQRSDAIPRIAPKGIANEAAKTRVLYQPEVHEQQVRQALNVCAARGGEVGDSGVQPRRHSGLGWCDRDHTTSRLDPVPSGMRER